MKGEKSEIGGLRDLQQADLDLLLEWRNHDDVRLYMYNKNIISQREHAEWFASCRTDNNKHLLIFELDGIPSGFVNFTIHKNGKVADWGFYLAPNSQKGIGVKLAKFALEYAFTKLNLHKLCGQVLEFNKRSIKFHLKIGFKLEGILVDQYYNGDAYQSIHCFGLIKNKL